MPGISHRSAAKSGTSGTHHHGGSGGSSSILKDSEWEVVGNILKTSAMSGTVLSERSNAGEIPRDSGNSF